MTDASTFDLHTAARPRRALRRAPLGRVASWTGRSAVSSATDSVLARIATAGARKTRVSEMRDVAARVGRRPRQGSSAATGAAASQRRRPSGSAATEVSG